MDRLCNYLERWRSSSRSLVWMDSEVRSNFLQAVNLEQHLAVCPRPPGFSTAVLIGWGGLYVVLKSWAESSSLTKSRGEGSCFVAAWYLHTEQKYIPADLGVWKIPIKHVYIIVFIPSEQKQNRGRAFLPAGCVTLTGSWPASLTVFQNPPNSFFFF